MSLVSIAARSGIFSPPRAASLFHTIEVFSWRADSGGLGGDGFAGEFGELVGGDGELFGEGLPFYEG
jgi:hypothetical protein